MDDETMFQLATIQATDISFGIALLQWLKRREDLRTHGGAAAGPIDHKQLAAFRDGFEARRREE